MEILKYITTVCLSLGVGFGGGFYLTIKPAYDLGYEDGYNAFQATIRQMYQQESVRHWEKI